MINNITLQEIEEAVRIHWKLQLGSYFESIHNLDGAVYNLGGLVTDYFWNYAGMINTRPSDADVLIERIIKFALMHKREPAFYIDPSTKPDNFTTNLTKAGFKADDDEIWMFFNQLPNALQQTSDLVIKEVADFNDMKTFVKVFHDSYEMLQDGDPSSPYGDSLLKAYKNKANDVKVHHFLGSRSGVPVSVSSIYMSGHDAGLYNVGTPVSHRGHGYGTALSVHAIKYAKGKGAKKILLQTELGGDAERLYSKLGFVQAFSAAIWAKEAE